jgi:transposase
MAPLGEEACQVGVAPNVASMTQVVQQMTAEPISRSRLLLEELPEIGRRAQRRFRMAAGRQVVGVEPSDQPLTTHSGLLLDPRNCHSACVQSLDIVEQPQPGLAACLTRSLSFSV